MKNMKKGIISLILTIMFVGAVYRSAQGWFGSDLWEKVKETTENIVDDVKQTSKEVLKEVKKTTKKVVDKTQDVAESVIDKAKGAVGKVMGKRTTTAVTLVNNTPLELRLVYKVSGDKKLKVKQNYKIYNKVIKPWSRKKVISFGRHLGLPAKLLKNTTYYFKTMVTPYYKGKQIGKPISLAQKVVKLPDPLASKITYGLDPSYSRGLQKAGNWKIDGRVVDVYCDDYLKFGKLFNDIEYAFSIRPYSGAKFDDNPNVLRILHYNVWMRPAIAFPFDGQVPRAEKIPKIISGMFKDIKPDVVEFNEVFEPSAYEPLKKAMKKEGYKYATKVIGEKGVLTTMILKQKLGNGGVVIFSKWPIVATKEKLYDKKLCGGSDCVALKGILYVKIDKKGKKYNIFASHTQSDTDKYVPKMREKQFDVMKKFIAQQKIPKNEPVFVVGDLNVDKYQHSKEYKAMLKRLNAVHPKHKEKQTHLKKEFLDYLLFLKDYKNPKKSSNKAFLEVYSQTPWIKWNQLKFKGIKNIRDLFNKSWPIRFDPSDHRPVLGVFEF